MPFPDGVQTVAVSAGTSGYRTLDGEPYTGTIRFTPSASRVVSTEHGVIALGPVNAALGASGQFTDNPELLANDADGFTPTGWTYRVDEEFTNAPGRAYSILLPAAVPTVALPSLVEVEASDGTVTWQPGGGGTPSNTVTAATTFGTAADAGDSTTYSRGDHTHGTPAAPTIGTTAGTYAAGDDSRITGAAQKAQNLSDLANASTARTNLGLGGAAVLGVGTGAGTVAAGDDSRLSNSRTPTVHAASHASGGGDPVTVAQTQVTGLDSTLSTKAAVTYVDSTFATQSTVSAIDGFLNDALTRVSAIEQGTAFLAGGHFTGDVEVIDADLIVRTAAGDVGKLRPTPWLFDVTDSAYGAAGDGQVVGDGAMSSGSAVLTSATAAWPSTVVGKSISVKGAGPTGVTTLVTTVASRQSATQVTLSAVNASGGAVSGVVVIWGTDDTAAVQAAVNAAETYLVTHTYAQVYFPPRPYIIAGALSTAKSGNGQITFGVYSTSGVKRMLEFRGEGDGAAAVRHWEQTVPQYAGSCLISLGVYSSTTAQTNDLNANGNPGVISGPNEGTSNGLAYGASARFSNVIPALKDLTVLTTHSAYGLTYGAANLYGCANAHVENFGYGTAGTVASPSTDYSSPGTFGTGLSVGLLLPAPGNNDYVIARNVSCGGGYTYALFLTEHAVVDRYMALYCWAGLCAVGNYAGSVGSVHAMKVLSASIEACTNELYIIGVGSSGVGPIIDIDQLSTENSTPNVAGNSAGAMAGALGRVKLTGLFTEAGVAVSSPTGIELVNGQVPAAIKRKTGAFTCSPIDRTLICDTTAAGFTGTLPAADFNPVEYVFKNVGANTLTVDTTSSQLIYTTSGTGATTATVATGGTLRVQALYNGSSWGWYSV